MSDWNEMSAIDSRIQSVRAELEKLNAELATLKRKKEVLRRLPEVCPSCNGTGRFELKVIQDSRGFARWLLAGGINGRLFFAISVVCVSPSTLDAARRLVFEVSEQTKAILKEVDQSCSRCEGF